MHFQRLVILLLCVQSLLLLRFRPFVPFRSLLSLSFTLSPFSSRKRAPTKDSQLFYRRIFSSMVRENFPVENLPAASAIGFLLVAAAVAAATTAFQSIRVRRKREREKKSAIYQSRSLPLYSRDRLRFRARIQQEFLAICVVLLFPFTNRFTLCLLLGYKLLF